jgi:hypothetical protein
VVETHCNRVRGAEVSNLDRKLGELSLLYFAVGCLALGFVLGMWLL